jgi:hypothetical protein
MSVHPSVRPTRRRSSAVYARRETEVETLETRRLMAVNLYYENFEELPLGPFVSPSESNGTGQDWTNQLPVGWSRNNTTTVNTGPAEFFGFTFMKKSSWVATEGDQERSLFTKGTGTVMVSDPDAYDDIEPGIPDDGYNVFIQTPAISLANAVPGTATVDFDSSFRPYDHMTASVEVSFDGGTNWTNLLSMNSANISGGDSSLVRVDEAVSLPLNNPAGAASAIVRFGMTTADNDWWWALDNIGVNATLDLPNVRLVGVTGEGSTNASNDESLFGVGYGVAPVTTTKLLKLPHVPDLDAIGFNPASGLLHHLSGAASSENDPAQPTFRDNQFMETVDVPAGTNAQVAVFNANQEQYGLPAPRPTFVLPTTRRTNAQVDDTFNVRGPNEYRAARDLAWSAADKAFFLSDETGIYKLTPAGQSTFVGDPGTQVGGLTFAMVNRQPQLLFGERDGSSLYVLDPATGRIVGDAIQLNDPGGAPLSGVLSLVTHPGTGDVYALARSAAAPNDPLQRDLLRITFATDEFGVTTATGTKLGTFTGLAMDDLAFVYPPPAAPPQVPDVYVRGSAWSTPFKQYLETKGLGDDVYGYKLSANGSPVAGPAANPQQVLPWINADQVLLKYPAAPTGSGIPTVGSVAFTSSKGVAYTVTGVSQVAGDPTAFVVALNKPLGGGNPTTGVAPTSNENGDHINFVLNGGGPGGSNLTTRLDVLQGDTDHTGETGNTHSVLASDFSAVKKKFFKSTTDAATGADTDYSAFHDVNGDGQILANDFSEVKKRFFQDLAPPPPTAAALGGASITSDLFGSKQIL